VAASDADVRVTGLDDPGAQIPEARAAIAGLVYDAGHDFYDCFGLSHAVLIEEIGDQVFRPGTEVGSGRILWADATVAGVMTWVPSAELRGARAISMAMLLRRVDAAARPAVSERLAAYATKIEPLEPAGIYLSRQAMTPDRRGQGLGRRLLEAVIAEIGDVEVSMHTGRDNQAVVRVYEPIGFRRVSESDYEWQAWVRPSQSRERG